jgi:hypothetical protein
VQTELIEHAARVLERTPCRTLSARSLYDRVSRETGGRGGLGQFLDALRSCPDRFAVIPAASGLVDAAGWTERERRRYADVLPGSVSAQPLVTLCEPPPAAYDAVPPADSHHAQGAELLDVHRSVAELLRSAGDDPALRTSVAAAVAALGGAALTELTVAAPTPTPDRKRPVRRSPRS